MINLNIINEELKLLDDGFNDISYLNQTYIIDFINNLKYNMFRKIYTPIISLKQLYIELEDILTISKQENKDLVLKSFFEQLPIIKQRLLKDVEAFIKNDPACKSKEEIIFSYNSFFAIFIYRIAHILNELNVSYIPRFLTEYAHSKTGIDIHPAVQIGDSFFIDHGTGVVIGETTIICDNVSIYQGVTLGAKSLKEGSLLKGIKRHPTICNNVIIYANATILGGNTIIKENSIIKGNAFITESN